VSSVKPDTSLARCGEGQITSYTLYPYIAKLQRVDTRGRKAKVSNWDELYAAVTDCYMENPNQIRHAKLTVDLICADGLPVTREILFREALTHKISQGKVAS
jgi:hypothetical protein